MNRLRVENAELRYNKELRDRDFENAMYENQTLYVKLENLENIFIGQPLSKHGEPDSVVK